MPFYFTVPECPAGYANTFGENYLFENGTECSQTLAEEDEGYHRDGNETCKSRHCTRTSRSVSLAPTPSPLDPHIFARSHPHPRTTSLDHVTACSTRVAACEGGTYSHSTTSPAINDSNKVFRICSPCPQGQVQWQRGQSNCLPCTVAGIECNKQGTLNLNPGFWRPNQTVAGQYGYNSARAQYSVSRCLYVRDCLGGNASGNSMCSVDSNGNVKSHGLWCATCREGFYRSDSTGDCERCQAWEHALFWLMLLVLILIGAIAYCYLRAGVALLETPYDADRERASYEARPTMSDRATTRAKSRASIYSYMYRDGEASGDSQSAVPQDEATGRIMEASCGGWLRRMFAQVPPSAPSDFAAVLKVLISYCQVRTLAQHMALDGRARC